MEWQAHRDSLCSGCGEPRVESFDPKMEDRYDVEVLVCHACAARERKARIRRDNAGDDPPAGEFYAVSPETEV